MHADTSIWKALLWTLSLLKNFVPFVILILLRSHLLFPYWYNHNRCLWERTLSSTSDLRESNPQGPVFLCNDCSLYRVPGLVLHARCLYFLLSHSLTDSFSFLSPLVHQNGYCRGHPSPPCSKIQCSILWPLLPDPSQLGAPATGVLTWAGSILHSSTFPPSSSMAPP